MKSVYAYELKVGDTLINIGKVTKIIRSTFNLKNYYQIYSEDNAHAIIFEEYDEVFISTIKDKELI